MIVAWLTLGAWGQPAPADAPISDPAPAEEAAGDTPEVDESSEPAPAMLTDGPGPTDTGATSPTDADESAASPGSQDTASDDAGVVDTLPVDEPEAGPGRRAPGAGGSPGAVEAAPPEPPPLKEPPRGFDDGFVGPPQLPAEPEAVAEPAHVPDVAPKEHPGGAGGRHPYDTGMYLIPPTPVTRPEIPSAGGLSQYMPTVPRRGPWAALGMLVLAAVSWAVSRTAQAAHGSLGRTGLLPSLARATQSVGRALGVLLLLAAIVALRPASTAPLLSWMLIAAAVAVGWSLRDPLQDVVAWGFLTTEGRIRPGTWVRSDEFEGRVESVTLRATTVADTRGEHTIVPNRALLRDSVRSTTQPFTEAEVRVHLPEVRDRLAREALREASMLSPWIAPGGEPEIGQDPGEPSTWVLRVRLLEGRFRDRFEGTFPARVHEVLDARRQR